MLSKWDLLSATSLFTIKKPSGTGVGWYNEVFTKYHTLVIYELAVPPIMSLCIRSLKTLLVLCNPVLPVLNSGQQRLNRNLLWVFLERWVARHPVWLKYRLFKRRRFFFQWPCSTLFLGVLDPFLCQVIQLGKQLWYNICGWRNYLISYFGLSLVNNHEDMENGVRDSVDRCNSMMYKCSLTIYSSTEKISCWWWCGDEWRLD